MRKIQSRPKISEIRPKPFCPFIIILMAPLLSVTPLASDLLDRDVSRRTKEIWQKLGEEEERERDTGLIPFIHFMPV
jgi:hypothetical protein